MKYDKNQRKIYLAKWMSNPKNKLRKIFYNMTERCCNKKCKDYPKYGGRGVTIAWSSFNDFYEDVQEMFYSTLNDGVKLEEISIDRLDPNGSYSLANVRFCSFSENSRINKRNNRYITYKGRTMIIADWARELGTSRQTIRNRLEKGWTVKQIIETKVSYSNRIVK